MKSNKFFYILLIISFSTGCSYRFFNSERSSLSQISQSEGSYKLASKNNETEKELLEERQMSISSAQSFPSQKSIKESSQELDNLFALAEESFKSGVNFSDKGDWNQAEDKFENALECLQNSPLRDKYPDEINKFYNKLVEDILSVLAKKEEPTERVKESILSATIVAKPEEEMTIKEKIMLDLQEISFDVPIEINQKVIDYVEYFMTEKKEPMARWLSRSGLYIPILRRIFSQEGLPVDLTYLPLIESAFNPDAYSYAKACGLWQFIPGTAKKFGLKINWWIDERKDFEKSTRAAANYLKSLYEQFNDWRLALAAYNAGEGRIAKAIQNQNTTNFWELNLHPQTMNYIPAYMASLLIAKNPKRYGFDIAYESSLDYDTVLLQKPVDLKTIAECAGTTRGIIKKLNPELRGWTTPPNTKNYLLRIPGGSKERFEIELAKIEEKIKVAWRNYRIRKNESLSIIAQKFNISIKDLMEANSISNPNKIIQGQTIIVPNRYALNDYNKMVNPSSKPNTSNQRDTNLLIYTVKNGDTLSKIARVNGVSERSIKNWNNLKSINYIYPKQKLKIYSYKPSKNKVENLANIKRGRNNGTSENFKEIIYIVKNGDTLWNIAKSHNISAEEIIAINKIPAKNTIIPGDKLKLKIPQEL